MIEITNAQSLLAQVRALMLVAERNRLPLAGEMLAQWQRLRREIDRELSALVVGN